MSARAAILLLAIAAPLACGHHSRPAPPPECVQREDCAGGLAGGLLCTGGKCTGCTLSRDCRITELCDPVQRICSLRSCFGDQCTQHADCPTGNFCVQGLCLDPAKPAVSGGVPCGVALCASARDCNPGQRCNERTFVCEQDLGCTSGAPCAAGTVCNPGSGACEPGCTAETAAQVCGALVPCLGGRCVQCAADKDCGPGLVCDVAAGECRGPHGCSSSRDCAAPTVCDRATATCLAPRGPCTSNESCATDQRCETRSGNCVAGACAPDRFDPNGSAAQAAPLLPGTFPQLSLCGPAGQDEDWFSLQLLSGDTVQVVANSDPLGSFDLQLRDDNGVLEEAPFAVLHLMGSTGRYYLRARTNDASALYGLRIQVSHGAACTHNPPQQHPSAAQALPMGAGPHYGFAICPGEATWFSISAAAGQGVQVQGALDPTQGGAVLLSLYDSDGQSLLAADASGSASPQVAAAAARGNGFFLRAAGSTSSATNHYDLTVRLTP